jgi:hypothetical protein
MPQTSKPQKTAPKPPSNKAADRGKTRQLSRRTRTILLALGGAALLGIILAASGFAFAATQEEHDSFCASCHTQPESTFYQRLSAAQPVDLASAHNPQQTRCIDCHSGTGVVGRLRAELMGAHNALAWYTGTAVQPAKVTVPIRDENCLKCHAEVTVQRDMNNHFHYFLAQWQAMDPKAATCVSCHGGHTTTGTAQDRFMDQAATRAVCDACHAIAGGGD